jgi:hypothetical protein
MDAATFAGLTIWIDGEQMTPREVEAAVSVRHIPGGNTSYIDLGGVNVQTLSVTIFLQNNAEYTALFSRVGTVGSLNYYGGSFQAILNSLSQTKIFPSGQQYADANFTLL